MPAFMASMPYSTVPAVKLASHGLVFGAASACQGCYKLAEALVTYHRPLLQNFLY